MTSELPETGRDRRDDGRPEQARPRDRTGRPLPYDTTGVPLTEEHEPTTVEEALVLGASLWDEGRYFEAHECLEHVWHAAPAADRDFWQGVIQVAVAGVHLQRGNEAGATALLGRAASRLAPYPAGHRGIDVEAVRRFCHDAAGRIAAGEAARVTPPPFPAMSGGAWFSPDPAASVPPADPTPVPDVPAWRAPPRSSPSRSSAPGSPAPGPSA